MFNVDIRAAMRRAGLFGYEIAAVLGVTESSFSRKIARKELPDEDKQEIFAVIDRLVQERWEAI